MSCSAPSLAATDGDYEKLDAAARANLSVLIGVLRHTVADVRRGIGDTAEWLKSRTGAATNISVSPVVSALQ